MAKEQLTAYCLKTKTKNTPFDGKPLIEQTKKGGYMAKGVDAAGNKMCAMLGKDKALKAIKDGMAEKAF